MKIAHLSDLHFGNVKTLHEVDACTTAAVEAAIAAGVELAIFSGDATDHELDVHAPAFIALAKQIRRLADHCPVLMLQGTFSHEPPGTLDIFRLMGGHYPIFVADRIQQVAWCPSQGWIASNSWRFACIPNEAACLITCIPTLNKGALASTVGADRAAIEMGHHLAALLAGFGAINNQARMNGIPTLGVSHGTVNGCLTEHGVPMAGLDHEFTSGALFAAQASAFLLGHIHKHQSWSLDGRHIAYPGSIGRLHYGEEDTKGWLLWNVYADGAAFELIPTPARRMLHFAFDGLPDLDLIASHKDTMRDAYVRVRWQVAEEDASAVDRKALEQLLTDAAEFKLEPRIIPVLRARSQGISQTHTLREKVLLWCAQSDVNPDGVVERLDALAAHSADEIVSRLLLDDAPAKPHTEFVSASDDRPLECAPSRANVTTGSCSAPSMGDLFA